eukprot:5833644-Ditylum_brightwellii.AAC.1
MEAEMDAGVPESNETSQLSPPDSSEVSMGKGKSEESKDNVEEGEESMDNEERSVMEAEMDAGVPE